MMNPYKITKVFVEDRDTSAKPSLPELNMLKAKTVCNGMGNYIVISTERWALDEDGLEKLWRELSNMLKEANK
jgi:hypothetical protein